jgi:hypothetical protein
MDRQTAQRAWIGFVMGGLAGMGLYSLGIVIFNLIYAWVGREPVPFTWWRGLLTAFVLGLAMAINMARPPFGD